MVSMPGERFGNQGNGGQQVPIAAVNGISLHFDDYGSGEPVILITGSGGRGRLWTPHQVPALTAAGYRVITIDNRGVPPTDMCLDQQFTVDDLVADTAALIRHVGAAPCRVVGFSLGGIIVSELLLARPELVSRAVLMATRGRPSVLQRAMAQAESELLASGIELPSRYAAVMQALHYLSPRTQQDDQRVRDWLDIFELSPMDAAINRAQRNLDLIDDRLEDYRKITTPCLVLAFQDDLIAPPSLGREVADRIPGCRYEEIAGCGHYGYLEEPATVNKRIIDFFRDGS
jgi:pimeloyl-ACP methyl ester carboxylesterase